VFAEKHIMTAPGTACHADTARSSADLHRPAPFAPLQTDTRRVFYHHYSSWKNYSRQLRTTTSAVTIDWIANTFFKRPELTYILKTYLRTARILELGSGSGAFLRLLASKGFQHLTGVDLSFRPADTSQIQYYQEDAFSFLSDRPDQFELVILLDVLEHFTKPEAIRLLHLCERRLTPTGAVLCRVPNAASPFALASVFGDLTHELHLTPTSISQLAATCRLSPIYLTPINRFRVLASTFLKPLDFAALLAYILLTPLVTLYRRGASIFHGAVPAASDAYLLFLLSPNTPPLETDLLPTT
jgi:2-polyprenyl-3-methyl-5-hydroxy-6-metoxy-1,4-benzoquinol methylase